MGGGLLVGFLVGLVAVAVAGTSDDDPVETADRDRGLRLVPDRRALSCLRCACDCRRGHRDGDKWGRPRWIYNAYRLGQWRQIEPFGGQLTEKNAVSALAELLVDRMFALEDAGDQIVSHRARRDCCRALRISPGTLIERIMSERLRRAVKLGVPVKAKAWVGKRYRK